MKLQYLIQHCSNIPLHIPEFKLGLSEFGETETGSFEFRELMFDFFSCQVNMHPTRLNHILDLVLSTTPEDIAATYHVFPTSLDNYYSNNSLVRYKTRTAIRTPPPRWSTGRSFLKLSKPDDSISLSEKLSRVETYLSETACPVLFNGTTDQTPILYFDTLRIPMPIPS
jgi:hypothetical protein